MCVLVAVCMHDAKPSKYAAGTTTGKVALEKALAVWLIHCPTQQSQKHPQTSGSLRSDD